MTQRKARARGKADKLWHAKSESEFVRDDGAYVIKRRVHFGRDFGPRPWIACGPGRRFVRGQKIAGHPQTKGALTTFGSARKAMLVVDRKWP